MIIADTGFWVALADKYHRLAIEKFVLLTEPLITTWAVVTEVCHVLLKRCGVQAELSFIHNYQEGAFTIFDLTPPHVAIIASLMEKYSDLPMDLADASLIILAEHLGHGRILSSDRRDFQIYRWKNVYPFDNLLLS